MKHLIFIILIIIFIITNHIKSQTIDGGVFGGFAGTQISGDNLAGFNKAGLYLGSFASIAISKKSSLQMEIDYIQKGSRKGIGKNDTTSLTRYTYRLRLNYIEIPLIYKYSFVNIYLPIKNDSTNSFDINKYLNALSFEIGLSYAHLVNYPPSEEDTVGDTPLSIIPFNKYDISIITGIEYSITKSLSFKLRWSSSVLAVRKHSSGATYRLNRGQYNDVLGFTLNYKIFAR